VLPESGNTPQKPLGEIKTLPAFDWHPPNPFLHNHSTNEKMLVENGIEKFISQSRLQIGNGFKIK
jgi:hypothetical protein